MAAGGGVVLNVIDGTATSVVTQVKNQDLKGKLVLFYPVSNWVAALMDVVINAAGGPGSIAVLRLWGHGMLEPHPGGIATMFHDDGSNAQLGLEAIARPYVQAGLPRLKPYFAPGARVELKHCRVATEAGWDWLYNLANAWGVEIHASANLQHLVTWAGTVYAVKSGRKPVPIKGIDP